MTQSDLSLPQPDTVLAGPFWPGDVRVVRATGNGGSIRIEAVGVADSQFYDRTLSVKQFASQVREVEGGARDFQSRGPPV